MFEEDQFSSNSNVQPIQGGSYKDVRDANIGGQVHHIPAWAAYKESGQLSHGDGPSIWMETADHYETASWGSGREEAEYRNQQKELIEQGKYQEALQMDVDDLQSKFGDKYDLGIQQAQEYAEKELGHLFPAQQEEQSTDSVQAQIDNNAKQNNEEVKTTKEEQAQVDNIGQVSEESKVAQDPVQQAIMNNADANNAEAGQSYEQPASVAQPSSGYQQSF